MAKIKEIRCIRTRVNGTWVIVKITTDQPGLYGIGSASDHYHAQTVVTAVEECIAPRLIGREVGHIEDIWQSTLTSGYWRNGAISNTALGGIDMALWDIKGKEAGMPVYQLLGGPCRSAVPCYAHAGGGDFVELEDDIRRYMEEGYSVIRCQLGGYGGGGFIDADKAGQPKNPWSNAPAFDDEAYIESIPKMFEYLRSKLGFGPKLTHDVHEHLRPQCAVTLSKLLEPYRLFFLEDVLSPEQIDWFRLIRQQCTTPQAMGELFISPHEWTPLITERLIDFVRVRVSKGRRHHPVSGRLPPYANGLASIRRGKRVEIMIQLTKWQQCTWIWQVGVLVFRRRTISVKRNLTSSPVTQSLRADTSTRMTNRGWGLTLTKTKAAEILDAERAKVPNYAAEDRKADGSVVRP